MSMRTDLCGPSLMPVEEIVEIEETEDDLAFFGELHDYGEFEENEMMNQAANIIAKPLSSMVTEKICEKRQNRAERRDNSTYCVEFQQLVNYAETLKAMEDCKYIEYDWIYFMLNEVMIDFCEYSESIQNNPDEIDKWTVIRVRNLIQAMVPCILYSETIGEVLEDFVNDFFIPIIVMKENNNSNTVQMNNKMNNFHRRKLLSEEYKLILIPMIENLISPVIIEKFVRAIEPILFIDDANCVFSALVQTMINFRIPEPLTFPKRIRPSDRDSIEYKEYFKQCGKDRIAKRYRNALICCKKIHKNRSFEILKILVTYFPHPIVRLDSQWTDQDYLNIPNRPDVQQQPDPIISGEDLHPNQDFFDVLFLSKVLRACLLLDDIEFLTANTVHPFFVKKHLNLPNIAITGRLWTAIDTIFRITKINIVANLPHRDVADRRFLIAYLMNEAAPFISCQTDTVSFPAIAFHLESVFESIWLYQTIFLDSEAKRVSWLKYLMQGECDAIFVIIFLTYNPICQTILSDVFESFLKVAGNVYSKQCIQAWKEVFALVRDVHLLPLHVRKVLKYINKERNYDMSRNQSGNRDSQATYKWSMSKAYKLLSKGDESFKCPYSYFAVQVVLARRFGISIDQSRCHFDQSEDLTWRELIAAINLYLERATQVLINPSVIAPVDSNHYHIYRVVDPHLLQHRQFPLPEDEPTNYLNLLISSGLNQINNDEREAILTKVTRGELYELYYTIFQGSEPREVLRTSPTQAAEVLLEIYREFFAESKMEVDE